MVMVSNDDCFLGVGEWLWVLTTVFWVVVDGGNCLLAGDGWWRLFSG